MDKRSGFNEWLNDTHGRVALRVGKADKNILAMEAHPYEYGFSIYKNYSGCVNSSPTRR